MSRLTAFEHIGSAVPPEQRMPFAPPGLEPLESFRSALDGWFARHNRGERAVRVELYPVEDEYWFLVRHGNTYARAPKIERQRTEILHFRPEQDDVIVYNPEHG